METTAKLETPTPDTQEQDTPCCQNPRTHGYPEENPIVQICLECGSWNWKKY